MSFLPEEDREFLEEKGIGFQELTETLPNGQERREVLFPGFSFSATLRAVSGATLVEASTCDLLVIIPDGYSTTRLDSFYTIPTLRRMDGSVPASANAEPVLFGRPWQFWSRHLDAADWRVGLDGLRTFISYIRGELRRA
jgi:hypothetical protein